ncbi:hypothetical protein HANVADRAFT_22900 [Hanseniaspora valbyensis NRRL Y-1626]|uniref:Flavin reductase like domain-containing protein n=1 Tax=Hanseniaspora valbyensis NRRL Y-1626 TaxID=766949 RepID=A0A1B7TFY3_9ASCO|nr:hypothetical protein HANVADRAFT_22900 [Hanseniaspora valbyensis NRRL Y-1626]
MTSVKNKFIDGMRQVANQVMILTTNSNKTSITNAKDFRGVTLSSCVSLAMKPFPMLQFNLMKPSFTSNVLHSSEPYRIALHSLPPTEKSTKLAKLFSKGANIQPLINSTWNKLEHSKNKLKTLEDYAFYEDKVPFLKNANVVFICETIPKMQFNVGDHEIWCVKVIDVLNPLSEGIDIKEENKGGLLYCSKNFYSLNSTTI